MEGRTDGLIDEEKDNRTDERKDGRTDGRTKRVMDEEKLAKVY